MLFHDGFDGGFPVPNWTLTGTCVVHQGAGDPVPCLYMDATSDVQSAKMTQHFAATAGTVVEARFATDGGCDALIEILDSGHTEIAVARVNTGPVPWSVRYWILGSMLAKDVTLASGWHVFRYRIDSSGGSTWFLDGVEGHTSSTPVPEHLKVKLVTATQRGRWYFDEVRVVDTAP